MNIKARNSDKTFIIDDEDAAMVLKFRWYYNVRGYYWTRDSKTGLKIYLHKYILGLQYDRSVDVDHINRITDDNRRSNLRACTHSENLCNSPKKKTWAWDGRITSSKYKGVSWDKEKGKWKAYTNINGTRFNGGYFKNEIEAVKKANELMRLHQGEFAILNSIV